MTKLVRYNGEKSTYRACSSPDILTAGKVYEVQCEYDLSFQTNYQLKGVKGIFNSIWFEEIEIPVVMALSHKKPELYKPLTNILTFDKGTIRQVIQTTPVQNIEDVEKGVFNVLTQNTIYIVQVVK